MAEGEKCETGGRSGIKMCPIHDLSVTATRMADKFTERSPFDFCYAKKQNKKTKKKNKKKNVVWKSRVARIPIICQIIFHANIFVTKRHIPSKTDHFFSSSLFSYQPVHRTS